MLADAVVWNHAQACRRSASARCDGNDDTNSNRDVGASHAFETPDNVRVRRDGHVDLPAPCGRQHHVIRGAVSDRAHQGTAVRVLVVLRPDENGDREDESPQRGPIDGSRRMYLR